LKITVLIYNGTSPYIIEGIFPKEMRTLKQITFTFLLLAAAGIMGAQAATVKTTRAVMLGETEVKINIYENEGGSVTFIAPHHNEQTGLRLAKEYIDKNGGKLVEIESFDAKGALARYITFTANGKSYTIDPNRIFTPNGRSCTEGIAEVSSLVEDFSSNILKAVFADGKGLPVNERFLVAIHNNTDVDSKTEKAKFGDLTAFAFVKTSYSKDLSHGIFQDQADGVYLSNTEDDQDNFIFLSGPRYVGYFAERGFNVVVQKAAAKLQSQKCTVDDGSLSVYSAQQNISYVCLEADSVTGGFRQRQMLESVYQLAKTENEATPLSVAKK
jgi:hypothetical protein